MSNFTPADVKRLRELTGSGMMDCKKALVETDGDFEKAVEYLRIKGAKDVGKRAGRTTANGLVAQSGCALVEVNCETDFVAKNTDFIALAQRLADHVASTGTSDVPAFLASEIDGQTVADLVQAESARIGEKLVVNRIAVVDGQTAVYMHRKSPDLPPQVGVIVAYEGAGEAAAEHARAIGMQIAAMRPKYLNRDEVPADVLENERHIAHQTALEEGKPAGAIPKIVDGRVNGFFKDVVLLDQPSVTDQKKNVRQVLSDAGVTVTGFARFEVGQA